MAYLDVIPLADAKVYLRIDDTLTEDDAQITRMIKGALAYVEQWTNVLVTRQAAKEYVITDRCVRVYDYPINSVVKGLDDEDADVTLTYETNYNKELKHLYTNYFNIDGDAVKLVLDVGYTDAANVPSELIDVAYELIDNRYYGHEDGKGDRGLSKESIDILNRHKRFLI